MPAFIPCTASLNASAAPFCPGGYRSKACSASASPSRIPRCGLSTSATDACGPDVVGQLVIRGATVMRGLLGQARGHGQENSRPVRCPASGYCTPVTTAGWTRRVTSTSVGRSDDLIKSRGEKDRSQASGERADGYSGREGSRKIGAFPTSSSGGRLKRLSLSNRNNTEREHDPERVPATPRKLHGAEVYCDRAQPAANEILAKLNKRSTAGVDFRE